MQWSRDWDHGAAVKRKSSFPSPEHGLSWLPSCLDRWDLLSLYLLYQQVPWLILHFQTWKLPLDATRTPVSLGFHCGLDLHFVRIDFLGFWARSLIGLALPIRPLWRKARGATAWPLSDYPKLKYPKFVMFSLLVLENMWHASWHLAFSIKSFVLQETYSWKAILGANVASYPLGRRSACASRSFATRENSYTKECNESERWLMAIVVDCCNMFWQCFVCWVGRVWERWVASWNITVNDSDKVVFVLILCFVYSAIQPMQCYYVARCCKSHWCSAFI